MAGPYLRPDLQEMLEKFTAIRQDYASLLTRNKSLLMLSRTQRVELEISRKNAANNRSRYAELMSAYVIEKEKNLEMCAIKDENNNLKASLDELKNNYNQLLISSNENLSDRDNRIKSMEEQLNKIEQKHIETINCLVLDYEAKLRSANEEVQKLTEDKQRKTESEVLFRTTSVARWPELEVIGGARVKAKKPRPAATRTQRKRKLFTNNEDVTDLSK